MRAADDRALPRRPAGRRARRLSTGAGQARGGGGTRGGDSRPAIRPRTRYGSPPNRTPRCSSCLGARREPGRRDAPGRRLRRGARRGRRTGKGPVLVPFSGHEHDLAAAEVGAWLGRAAVTLLGVHEGRDGRDASRMLASASLALRRGFGIEAETQLVPAGAAGVVQHPGAAIVVGLSERWISDGLARRASSLCARRHASSFSSAAACAPAASPHGGAHALHLVERWLITAPTTGPRLSRTGGCS